MTRKSIYKKILFLFSDTGGGHRSSSEAIMEAIELEFPGKYEMDMVDVFKKYTPPPLQQAPEIYPPLTKMPNIWEAGFRISDGKKRTHFMSNMFWPYLKISFDKLVKQEQADLYVSVHPLLNYPVLQSLQGKPPVPFVTVVTDMVSAHAFWFDNRANKIIVPTEDARQRGLEIGIDPERIVVAGQPVADRFCQPVGDKNELRRKFGWPEDKPLVLLVGGGEGSGPLEETAYAIERANLDIGMVIITGRNKHLAEKLNQHNWQTPTHVYGFVTEMPDFMRAVDVIVTKAGPGTISEAFIAGLPIIMYSRFPGQEDGNVLYVMDQEAGVWAPEPEKVIATLNKWINNPETRLEVAAASKKAGRPQATRQIARLLIEQLEGEKQPSSLPSEKK